MMAKTQILRKKLKKNKFGKTKVLRRRSRQKLSTITTRSSFAENRAENNHSRLLELLKIDIRNETDVKQNSNKNNHSRLLELLKIDIRNETDVKHDIGKTVTPSDNKTEKTKKTETIQTGSRVKSILHNCETEGVQISPFVLNYLRRKLRETIESRVKLEINKNENENAKIKSESKPAMGDAGFYSPKVQTSKLVLRQSTRIKKLARDLLNVGGGGGGKNLLSEKVQKVENKKFSIPQKLGRHSCCFTTNNDVGNARRCSIMKAAGGQHKTDKIGSKTNQSSVSNRSIDDKDDDKIFVKPLPPPPPPLSHQTRRSSVSSIQNMKLKIKSKSKIVKLKTKSKLNNNAKTSSMQACKKNDYGERRMKLRSNCCAGGVKMCTMSAGVDVKRTTLIDDRRTSVISTACGGGGSRLSIASINARAKRCSKIPKIQRFSTKIE